jgi:hypothetical protein
MPTVQELAEAREYSLKHGVGTGVRPRRIYGIEVTFRDESGKHKRWVAPYWNKATAKRDIETMKKYPFPGEKPLLLEGKVEWSVMTTEIGDT